MSSCLPCVKIKHQTYVNNCYPSLKDPSTQPRSSELSYLTFYATSKPAKLTKVGTYIQRKVEKDIRKGRKTQNLVSLRIIKELIQTCHRDLNIFSRNVVKIMNELLDTRDIEIIDLTCETFITFCSCHDGTTIGVDSSFTNDYEKLITSFAGFCKYSTKDSSLDLKMRYIGHRALQAAVTSNGLQASNFKSQLNILFPPLINTLASSRQPSSFTNLGDGSTVDIRESTLNNEKINIHATESIAAHTVSLLFSKVTGPFVRRSLTPLFCYLDENKKWWPPYFAVNIMKLVLESLQPQYRYLLVSEILQQLDDNTDNKDSQMLDDKNLSLVSILDVILNANVSLAGISVLEVLNYLYTYLIRTAQSHPFEPDAIIINDDSREARRTNDIEKNTHDHANIMQHRLIHSIEGLASQIYYSNQFNDMFGYLTSKLRANTALDKVDNLPIHDYRLIGLKCMEGIIHRSAQNLEPSTASDSETNIDRVLTPHAVISAEAWNPALGLLQDSDPRTRKECSKCLYEYLQIKPSLKKVDGLIQRTATSDHSDIMFMERLVYTMHDWVRLPQFNKTDLRCFFSFLCQLNYKFGIEATVLIVPLVFKIQDCIQKNNITINARQRALQDALIAWFKSVAVFYNIESLTNYISTLEMPSKRSLCLSAEIDDGIWRNGNKATDNFVEEPDITMNDTEWIDRGIVVELMSNEGNLRDDVDTYGLDLEARLFAEWGSDAFLSKRSNNSHFKDIRSKLLQESGEDGLTGEAAATAVDRLKPRLASPWVFKGNNYLSQTSSSMTNSSSENQQQKQQHNRDDEVKVSTLKDALIRQQFPVKDDDSQLSGSQSVNKMNHSRTTSLSRDISDILNELNLDPKTTTTPITAPLVNPPYQSILS